MCEKAETGVYVWEDFEDFVIYTKCHLVLRLSSYVMLEPL